MIGSVVKGAKWLMKNADRSKVRAFREFLQNNPKIAAIGTGYGVYEILDLIEKTGDPAAIAALNDAAASVGVDLETLGDQVINTGKTMVNTGASLVGVGPVFEVNTTVSAADVRRDEALTQLARFLKGEVSGNPGYLFRYWQQMGAFLRMDEASVKNFLGGAYFK